jgi:hypothetical protein
MLLAANDLLGINLEGLSTTGTPTSWSFWRNNSFTGAAT